VLIQGCFLEAALEGEVLRDDQWVRIDPFVPGGRKGKRGQPAGILLQRVVEIQQEAERRSIAGFCRAPAGGCVFVEPAVQPGSHPDQLWCEVVVLGPSALQLATPVSGRERVVCEDSRPFLALGLSPARRKDDCRLDDLPRPPDLDQRKPVERKPS
jgi:hypothetical protein